MIKEHNQAVLSCRGAGILLPISSLPSAYGIGTFGRQAYRFVNFLRLAGQRYWQVLPIGPTSYGDSPYQSFSAFAGNPYYIDLEILCKQGLLTREECESCDWGSNKTKADYKKIYHARFNILRMAYWRFSERGKLTKFREENAQWIENYALYMAVKQRYGMRSWLEWREDIKLRRPEAVARCTEELKSDIDFYVFLQYEFFKQWYALKRYANRSGIKIIGDIPIYVAMDSADTWAESALFLLDEEKNPVSVAGCPPDAFSETGQLWGNPLYRWNEMRKTNYEWWVRRLKFNTRLYDVIRIDHFRGFERYYAIPYGDKTAENGVWEKGPGIELFDVLKNELGEVDLIAEDLGYLTEEVKKLLRDSGYPGMKVLQFAFDAREESDYLPYHYTQNCVVYTGTHDNDTVRGWAKSAPKQDVEMALKYLNCRSVRQLPREFIRAAYGSVANTAIVPMQDFLNLGSGARVNLPSTLGGNWEWRLQKSQLTPTLAGEIREMASLYGRAAPKKKPITLKIKEEMAE